jgi:phosphate transport system substrate-binding protein
MRNRVQAWGGAGWRAAVVAGLLAAAPAFVLADTVRLAGSITLVSSVIAPHREQIEKSSGHSLQIVSNATGKGLADVAERSADIAMISAPLDVAIAAAVAAGKKVDPGALRVHELRSEDIVFLVSASNPVAKLSLAQIGDIQTGRIRNWKEVGGKDLPITVYTTGTGSGTSAVVKKAAMNGGDYAAGTKTMLSFARMAELLPADEGGIGALGRGFVRSDGKAKVIETPRIARPLALVTYGEPSPAARQVINAIKAAASGAPAAVDIAALCATQVKPEMPRKALQDGVEGVVRAQAVIRDGAVRDVTILSGPRVFHTAVREAMLQYKCSKSGSEAVAAQEFVFKGRPD